MFHNDQVRGGFRGGGEMVVWGRTLSSPYGFDPLSTKRVSPLYYFEIFILVTDPKNFLKASSAPMYTNFEEGATFWSKLYKKCQTLFWPVFFSKFRLRRRKVDQNRFFLVLWESLENLFGRPF